MRSTVLSLPGRIFPVHHSRKLGGWDGGTGTRKNVLDLLVFNGLLLSSTILFQVQTRFHRFFFRTDFSGNVLVKRIFLLIWLNRKPTGVVTEFFFLVCLFVILPSFSRAALRDVSSSRTQ